MLPKTVEEMDEVGWSPCRKSKGSDLSTICLPTPQSHTLHPQAAWGDWLHGIKQMDVDLSLLQCLEWTCKL